MISPQLLPTGSKNFRKKSGHKNFNDLLFSFRIFLTQKAIISHLFKHLMIYPYCIYIQHCMYQLFLVKEIFGSDKFKLFPSIMHSYSKRFLSGKKKFVNQEVFLSKTNQISLTTMQFLVFHVFLASPNF